VRSIKLSLFTLLTYSLSGFDLENVGLEAIPVCQFVFVCCHSLLTENNISKHRKGITGVMLLYLPTTRNPPTQSEWEPHDEIMKPTEATTKRLPLARHAAVLHSKTL